MDEYGFNDGDRTEPLPGSAPIVDEKESFPWGALFLGIWALALVIFSVQNAEQATIDFLWWSFDMPVALLVIVTALITMLLTGIGLTLYRRRKRKRAREARDSASDL